MTDAFNPKTADFSGISSNPLYISWVYHKAFINVDEVGTEAAAATAVGMTPTCVGAYLPPPVVFNADHPFLFLIRDTQSGSVLFMGQVADPTTTGGDASAPAVPKAQPGTQDPTPTDPVVVAPVLPMPVVFNSTPVKQASVGHVYTYQVTTDATIGQEILFSLGAAPAGMTISASTGLVIWSPTAFKTGSNPVTVLATDQFGDTGQQTFDIDVFGVFTPYDPFGPMKWARVIVGPVFHGLT